ncbi:uncharacterized protein LOC101889627 isoform X1 [Musca domestica]|uniref:Uncharacterized protein LOC101889627 isoform X1 n=1 Tax=Musca domestica TaxID=7370 RepID=A0ABM3V7X7_MUSDO|nr:uncharacterized protein LOC101889627 isoform X1 [Musca domestica]XP_058981873.1 uncharacterized protein LOC101889627 isoform X1 [Musca domestica]XP_058981874.1 uncharacterized protein LOC101889627 isoform X1 [Musca domestica]
MYICFKCRKELETPTILIRHFKSNHLLTRQSLNILCMQNSCKQTFTNFSYFRMHLEKVHTNESNTNNFSETPNTFSSSETVASTKTHSVITEKITHVPFTIQELKYKALDLSLSLYDMNSMPRNHVITIQNTISSLVSSIAAAVSSLVKDDQIQSDIKTIIDFCKNPFEDIATEYRMIKTLKNLMLYEDPKLIAIDEKIAEIICHGNPTLGVKTYDVIVMPLQFMIKSIFEIPDLLNQTLENIQNSLSDSNYTSLANGEIFKKKVEQLGSTFVIPYILYFDDFQINNALGSHTYSICGCYIHFPLMPKYLLSKIQFIFSAAFISTSNLKECGNERSFYHFAEELKQLEMGIDVLVGGKIRKIRFILCLIVGDNLAVNSILGYVESFNAKRFCRTCRRLKSEMQFDSTEIQESIRTDVTYQNDLDEGNYKETGLKSSCIFNDLEYFNVADNFAFDIMHDVYEGVCEYDVCKILVALINENIICLNTINSRKKLFTYGETEIGNTSAPLNLNRLTSCKLKMTASESACFVHFLPLMIGDLVPPDNQNWLLLLLLLDIIDLLFRSKYTSSDLDKLKLLVKNHHTLYTKLFGALKPKHHFIVHYATAIQKCGPLRYIWSMRFEAKHKDAKIYFNSITSRINPPYSLAIKNGLKFAKFLLERRTGLEPIYECSSFNTDTTVATSDYVDKINKIEDLCLGRYKMCADLTFKGTRYKSSYYLGIVSTDFELYKIIHLIVSYNDKFL